MILSEKLLSLRTKAGLSQEELAAKLNVSRQSVSKWELGTSIPGIDKILEIGKLYDVSIDYLLKDEIEELPEDIVVDEYKPEDIRVLSLDTVNTYLATIRKCSEKIALGVALCILSPIPVLLFAALYHFGLLFPTEDLAGGIGAAVLLSIIAAAVILFILNGLQLNTYEYLEKEKFSLSYGISGILEKESEELRPSFNKAIAYGAALCVIACVPLVVVAADGAGTAICLICVAFLLGMVALGVYMIVRQAIRMGAYDKLLQRGDYTEAKKQENRRLEVFDTAYWCIVTAIYLALSFISERWDVSWILWPVAGVAFAAVRSIVSGLTSQRIEK